MPPSIIERALELARSNSCRSINDIRRQLRAERYEHVDSHTSGKSIQNQLKAALRDAA